jgi:hypothetical protein
MVFCVLGAIHLNWVFGGKFGFNASLPTKETGERVLNPKRIDSAIVAVGLFLFSVFYLAKSSIIAIELPDWISTYGSYIIPTIFLLRAIGDFRYIGFFKKIKNTTFGKLDSQFYAPLCLGIGIAGLLITYLEI